MRITFDPVKREKTLAERRLDFADATDVFAGDTLTLADDRYDYGEDRYQTYGMHRDRLVMIVWTPRGKNRHVISMRHCHEREARRFENQLGRP